MAGVEPTRDALEGLGFDVSLTDHDAGQLAIRARRYGRDRLPIRDLEPMEFLAHFPDGPITAKATVTLANGVVIPQGATYELRSRWFWREEEVGAGEQKGEGRSATPSHTFVDRGYLVLRLTPTDPTLQPLTVERSILTRSRLVGRLWAAQVPTVADLPTSRAGSASWSGSWSPRPGRRRGALPLPRPGRGPHGLQIDSCALV